MYFKAFFSLVFLFLFACNTTNSTDSMKKEKDLRSNQNRVIISVPVVKKKFVDQNWNVGETEEFYIRRSVQDYIIKTPEKHGLSIVMVNVLIFTFSVSKNIMSPTYGN